LCFSDEVDKIMDIYPAAKLVLRILPDDKYSLMPFGKKFGASWEESKALLQKCKAMNASVIGVSFHVGSGCFDTTAYEKALQLAREV
jgi:ornithine decarboxylase